MQLLAFATELAESTVLLCVDLANTNYLNDNKEVECVAAYCIFVQYFRCRLAKKFFNFTESPYIVF